ncbi:MAG: M28 family peptidase [Planctomycetota bacterium]|nr:M28 family peptidase [Planctomycetota bacterium]
MRYLPLSLLLLLLLPLPLRADDDAPAAPAAPAAKTAPSIDRIRADCEWLCAVERMGRKAWEHREASAAYIAKAFKDAGLQPLPGKADYFDDHDVDAPFDKARNVVGWLPGKKAGTTKDKPGSYVILSAHYDHLGAFQRKTTAEDGTESSELLVAPGADDNASGTAALLEIARLLAAEAKTKPLDRSVVFLAFDLEEQNLIGSRAYAAKPPLPLDQMAAFVTMDQLGRSLVDVTPGTLFLMGTESCAGLSKVLDELDAPKGGKKLILGIDFQPGYSDYVPFKDKKLPYLFVTSGTCADYHAVTDTPDKLEWPHLAARTAWCRDLTVMLADAKRTFTWLEEPAYHPEEMKGLRAAIAEVEKGGGGLGLPEFAMGMLKNYGAFLDKILADGEVTKQERMQARATALMLFNMAAQIARQAKR